MPHSLNVFGTSRRWAILFAVCCCFTAFAQHPYHVTCDDETGLPSNEVYSIAQDGKGFIWIGADAGLYRFNGVRYQQFTSKTQASRAMAGLCFSSSGKLYGFNFKGQLFCVEDDRMKEIRHSYGVLQSITTDQNGNLFVNHNRGISVWNERTKQWKTYSAFGTKAHYVLSTFTKSARKSAEDGIRFITTKGVGLLKNGKVSITVNDEFKDRQLGSMLLECTGNTFWVFSSVEPIIYTCDNRKLVRFENPKLQQLLKGRKITNVKLLPDGNLWICTYNGIIRFHPKTLQTDLFFEQYSFSDALQDKNEKYWFSTLHNGLIMVPEFGFKVWNSAFEGLKSEKITKVIAGENGICFATGNGQLGTISHAVIAVKLYETGQSADIQTLYFDPADHCVYAAQSNRIFSLKNGVLKTVMSGIPSVKKILHFGEYYCFASSNGLLVNKGEISSDFEIINRKWNRDLCFLAEKQQLWTATNEGILVYALNAGKFKHVKTLCSGDQVLALAYSASLKRMYALIFDGRILEINPNGTVKELDKLHGIPQVNGLFLKNERIFVTTSKGVFSRHLTASTANWWTVADGLASNVIQELCFTGNVAWLATGKGVQQFSFSDLKMPERGSIVLRNVNVDGKSYANFTQLQLKQGQGITLFPEANLVSAFGNYRFAYRFKGKSQQWYEVPGTSEEIFIPSVPDGDFQIELQLIDSYGRISENTIVVKGTMQPPFYRTAWFVVGLLILVVLIGWSVYRFQINRLRRQQQREIERLQLESDLRLTQQTALKAQMNPHFIFNVLNSIKAYIYKNDKAKAAAYLSDFSDLIRGVLNMTGLQYVSLAEEMDFLKIYIELEAMMLSGNFEWNLDIEDGLELTDIQIPSLLLQPFVENAFKHGLHHKEGNKQLSISMREERDVLHIWIRDNGIGRQRSAEINDSRPEHHQSFATDATEKRMALINKEGKMQVRVEVLDTEQKGVSTTVHLYIIRSEEE